MTKPLVARKLAVRQLVFWLLVVSSFNYFKMHAWSCTSMLLLLHFAFMLSVVKLLLKGEVGVCALNSHGNYIVDHGKSWKNHGIVFLNFCGNCCHVFVGLNMMSTYMYIFFQVWKNESHWELSPAKKWGAVLIEP